MIFTVGEVMVVCGEVEGFHGPVVSGPPTSDIVTFLRPTT